MRELRCLEPSLNEMKDITVPIDHNSTKLDDIKIMLFLVMEEIKIFIAYLSNP